MELLQFSRRRGEAPAMDLCPHGLPDASSCCPLSQRVAPEGHVSLRSDGMLGGNGEVWVCRVMGVSRGTGPTIILQVQGDGRAVTLHCQQE